MKVAVLGGTFNPIHYGHLRIAEEVRESLRLDKVLFMPTYITPHKTEEAITPPEVRLEMIRTAIADNPGFGVSEIEIRRGGRSFTVDTLRELKKKEEDISLIIGNDSFNDITSWYEYEELFRLSSFIVVPRPGHTAKKPGEVLPVELARKFWYDSSTGCYQNSYGNSLTYLATTLMDVSSSDIRKRVKESSSIKYLLPDSIIEMIRSGGLYK